RASSPILCRLTSVLGPLLSSFPPAMHQIPRSVRPIGKLKFEPGPEQASWHYAPALQNQFCLRTKKNGANLEHPFCGWKPDWSTPSRGESAHEVRVGKRVRRTEIDRAIKVVA